MPDGPIASTLRLERLEDRTLPSAHLVGDIGVLRAQALKELAEEAAPYAVKVVEEQPPSAK